jgi:hypothetical protein
MEYENLKLRTGIMGSVFFVYCIPSTKSDPPFGGFTVYLLLLAIKVLHYFLCKLYPYAFLCFLCRTTNVRTQ